MRFCNANDAPFRLRNRSLILGKSKVLSVTGPKGIFAARVALFAALLDCRFTSGVPELAAQHVKVLNEVWAHRQELGRAERASGVNGLQINER